MRSLYHSSLRRKQTLIIMLNSSVVLLLACAAFIVYDQLVFRRELVDNVSVLASAIGNNCAAAIDFNDPLTAANTLTALQANQHIVAACVYNRDGQVFATYQRNRADASAFPNVQTAGQVFTGDQLHLFRTILQKYTVSGVIFVASDLDALSTRLLRYLGIGGVVFLASLALSFGLSSQLQRLVSAPILSLARVARSVAQDKNYSMRATKTSQDELGQLVDGFNEMLVQIQARDSALQLARDNLETRVEARTQELKTIHQRLLEVSRRGGMAEIATNVLHNVGNVLNSVNVSTGVIVESVTKSRAAGLAQVVVLLQEHAQDLGTFITQDSRGQQVPRYLAQLSEHLIANQATILRELNLLQQNVEHIKDIVAMQQNYSTFGGVKEMIDVVPLAEDSLRLNESGLSRHRVEVIREFAPVPLINVEKHKILHILVNLVRNAQYACNESSRADKRLTMRVVHREGRIEISVRDNGMGIPPANLTRIFNHGFTTRQGGHGFGLHSGALAAKEMGGVLRVHSDGLGQGATFTLELPCPAREKSHES